MKLLSIPLALIVMLSVCATTRGQTALDDYIAKPDDSYSYNIAGISRSLVADTYVLRMTSQEWRDPSEVDRTRWNHDVFIIVPNVVRSTTASMVIGGGSYNSDWRGFVDPNNPDYQTLLGFAQQSGSVVALVNQVPYQPLRYSDETRRRSEDASIAYTYDKYLDLEGSDPEWPLLLPMTKSVVRAMDTTQAFVDSISKPIFGREIPSIDDFVVLGASKRGWTTWLTAAVDDRVKAIMPMVYDNLNLVPQFLDHFENYGQVTQRVVHDDFGNTYAEALSDYAEFNLPARLVEPASAKLQEIVDPYSYRDRLAEIPKYIVNSAGDEFFLNTSSSHYYDDIPGEKYLRYVPNVGHPLVIPDSIPDDLAKLTVSVAEGYAAYYEAVLNDIQLPDYSFSLENDGTEIVATLDMQPDVVRLWMAENPLEPDFRMYNGLGPTWHPLDLFSYVDYTGDGTYIAHLDRPDVGYAAYFLEFTINMPSGSRFVFTTGVSMLEAEKEGLAIARIESAAVPEVSSLVMVALSLAGAGLVVGRRWSR